MRNSKITHTPTRMEETMNAIPRLSRSRSRITKKRTLFSQSLDADSNANEYPNDPDDGGIEPAKTRSAVGNGSDVAATGQGNREREGSRRRLDLSLALRLCYR